MTPNLHRKIILTTSNWRHENFRVIVMSFFVGLISPMTSWMLWADANWEWHSSWFWLDMLLQWDRLLTESVAVWLLCKAPDWRHSRLQWPLDCTTPVFIWHTMHVGPTLSFWLPGCCWLWSLCCHWITRTAIYWWQHLYQSNYSARVNVWILSFCYLWHHINYLRLGIEFGFALPDYSHMLACICHLDILSLLVDIMCD